MKVILNFLIASGLMIAVCGSTTVTAQDYTLAASNMVAGGGQVTGGTFDLYSSIGQFDAGESSGGTFTVTGGFLAGNDQIPVLLGDVNLDGAINLLDVAPFIDLIASNGYQAEADINQDGSVNLLDVSPFVDLLAG